jgi:hypothetical protein
MSEPTAARRRSPRRQKPPVSLPQIVCGRCSTPIVREQRVDPVIEPARLRWSEHPVLSKQLVIQGEVSVDGSDSRGDMSLEDQLRQRAAMGGEKERAELAAFEALWTKFIADALVAELRREAEVHGVDVWTWLARDVGEQHK